MIKVEKLTRGYSCNACGNEHSRDPYKGQCLLFIELTPPVALSQTIRLCVKCWRELVEKVGRKQLPDEETA